MSRASLWPRLVGILVGTALGLYYIGIQIIGWSFFDDDYRVGVDLPRSSGLYENSEVTYRGVGVGTVDTMTVGPAGVRLTLKLNKDQAIPRDVQARVRMLSALGESYVDLVPDGTAEPRLAEGDVLATARVPASVSTALESGANLLRSIDPGDIETVQTLFADAFTGLAPELRTLVVSGQRFLNAVIDAAPGTRTLILDGLTVLRTGNATQGELAEIIRSFDVLSRQLAENDDDFGQLLRDGGSAASTIEDLVRTQSQPFRELLQGSGAIGTALSKNSAAVKVLFDLLPKVSTDLSKVARNGVLYGDLTLNVGQPVCSNGSLPLPSPTGTGPTPSCDKGPGLLQRGPN